MNFLKKKLKIKKNINIFSLSDKTTSKVANFFSSLGDSNMYSSLIFIPILGQMLHFYIDSQIWKFREKHNREYTLSYIIKILN